MIDQLQIQLTTICKLGCDHCIYNCGPEGETMSDDVLKKVVANMPQRLPFVSLTGGEVFLEIDKLKRAVNLIKNRNLFYPPGIGLQTSGFWIRDDPATYNLIEELAFLGAGYYEIASDDIFHRRKGVNAFEIENIFLKHIKRLESSRGLVLEYKLKGAHNLVPLGRGKPLRQYHEPSSQCISYNFHNTQKRVLLVSPTGRANLCCYQVLPDAGNLAELDYDTIYQQAMSHKEFGVLLKHGPIELAKVRGVYRSQDKSDWMNNPCKMCIGMFGK